MAFTVSCTGSVVATATDHTIFTPLVQDRLARRSLGEGGSGRLLAVDHPWDAEPIDHHAETGGPEGLLKRHTDLPVFYQRVEDAFGIRSSIWRSPF
jgi:hypothetical protein